MKLVEKNNLYFCICNFKERNIPRSAGFLFQKWPYTKIKVWGTTEHSKALALLEYADTECFDKLMRIEASVSENIEASKAVACDKNFPVPKGLSYFPFQKAGINFCLEKSISLIADDMGVGKTIQAIGVINTLPKMENIIIVCPAHLKLNWQIELNKWLVGPYFVGIAGKKFPETSIVIINYDILVKWDEKIKAVEWDLAIFDESHFLKEQRAKRTKAVFGGKGFERIKTKKAVFMTGTPVLNRPVELFTLLKYAGLADNYRKFTAKYCSGWESPWGWDVRGASNTKELQQLLRSTIMIRRTKSQVLKDLPGKSFQIISIPSDGKLKLLKEEAKQYAEFNEKVKGLTLTAVEFSELAKIRHITATAKIPYAVMHLKEVLETDQKVIVFGWHTDILTDINKAFKESVIITGSTDIKARQKAVEAFQNDENCRMIVGNMQAMGTGYTLTAASVVVFVEMDFRPGFNNQCIDRAVRIGQTKNVLVQYLVFDGSIDANIAKMVVEKQKNVDEILDI